MAKPKNSFERMARAGAQRLDEVRGQQISLLPDEPGLTPAQVAGREPGRPKGAKGKVNSQMRDWLAANGYAMPEHMLAQMAGLASRDDAVLNAMAQAERVLAWAYDGEKNKNGSAIIPTGAQRRDTFLQLYAIQLRAADALLPYGAPKASPDVAVQQSTTIVMPGAADPTRSAAQPRDITPSSGRRIAPPPMPDEMQQNQTLSETENRNSDDKDRTE